jgi:uncharacterized BrkB/YihY/UPF0761 family membrane protein
VTNDGFVEYTPEGRPPRTGDFFATVLLLLLLVILTGVFVVVAFALSVSTLGCGDSSSCNGLVIGAGTLTVMIGAPVIALAGIIVSVVWIARRKRSWVIALIACLLSVGVFLLGTTLVRLAVPSA